MLSNWWLTSKSTRQLRYADVNALLGYYLGCIVRHQQLRKYISNERNSFEHLRTLLIKRAKLEKADKEVSHAA